MNGNRMTPVAGSNLLLLLLVGRLGVPVEEDLDGNEAIAEGGNHKDSSHEGVSSFLRIKVPDRGQL
jgi:hypothetical protein